MNKIAGVLKRPGVIPVGVPIRPRLLLSLAEVRSHLDGVIENLEGAAATVDVLAMKRLNLLNNRWQIPTSSACLEGLQREIFEFIHPEDEFFEELTGLNDDLEQARKQHRSSQPILEEMRSEAEEKLMQIIEATCQKELSSARNLIESLKERAVLGFLAEEAATTLDLFTPEKPNRQEARKIEKIISFLMTQFQELSLRAREGYRVRNVEPIWSYNSSGAQLLTLPPRYLGIEINPFDGAVRGLYRDRDTKHESVEVALRSLKHAIDSEVGDRLEVADEYSKKVIPIITAVAAAVKAKIQLAAPEAMQMLDNMQEIFRDIGRGVIRDHFKIRAAHRIMAAIRALNCFCPPESTNISPIRTAHQNLVLARAYLAFRREETTSIEAKLERKYASLLWFMGQDRQRHQYLLEALNSATSKLSLKTPVYQRDFEGVRKIFEEILKAVPGVTYYGYKRLQARLSNCLKMLYEINRHVAAVLEDRDKTKFFNFRRQLEVHRKVDTIAANARSSVARGKNDFMVYSIEAARGYLKVLLEREYVLQRPPVKRDLAKIADRLKTFKAEEGREISDLIAGVRRRCFPANGQKWQRDGFRLTGGAIRHLNDLEKITGSGGESVIKLIEAHLSEVKAVLTEHLQFALSNNPPLSGIVERLTHSMEDNLSLALNDLNNRTQRFELPAGSSSALHQIRK